MSVYADDQHVYVQWDDRGPFLTLARDGLVSERFSAPSADELTYNGDAYDKGFGDAYDEGYDEGQREMRLAVLDWAGKRRGAVQLIAELNGILT